MADEGEDTQLTHRGGSTKLMKRGGDAEVSENGRDTRLTVQFSLHGAGLLLALAGAPT